MIEVALPLDAINAASAREKSIRQGHPSTLHLWWARRPLAAARAVIFAQMVDDPSSWPDLFPTEKVQEKERRRLFHIVEELVKWENTTNEQVLQLARDEIWQSWRRTCAENADHPRARELFDRYELPAFHDPFAGGGALPLEAQRLGLESHASDLNPVAVLINKAMIEIPPKFAGRPPVNPETRPGGISDKRSLIERDWTGAKGLAEDVRYYGQWMREEAERRLGNLYPKVRVTENSVELRSDLKQYVGQDLTVIAWLWARTVKSPNPAFADVDVPLVSTFMLSTKKGKESYVEPVIEGREFRFKVKVGTPKDLDASMRGTTSGKRQAFRCVMSDTPVTYDHIRSEGRAGRLGTRLMAIIAEGNRGRIYLTPTYEHELVAHKAVPEWKPHIQLPKNPRDFKTPNYGMETFADLFIPRQLVALTEFSNLVAEAIERIKQDVNIAGLDSGDRPRDENHAEATAYANAVAVYLSFAVDKCSDYWSSICSWHNSKELVRNTFGRQAIPMVWDFTEGNPFCDSTGNFMAMIEWVRKSVVTTPSTAIGFAQQADATSQDLSTNKVVSTDPPYYDNIGYANLSDYFYIWLRRSLRSIFPDLFATLAVPKTEELVADPYRHGSKESAETFFLKGMTQVMNRLSKTTHPTFPVTIYYAFKQSETKGNAGVSRTGWETFLEAVIRAGFSITGTWPIRTELSNRMVGMHTNALASSIVLVCRQSSAHTTLATRREFINALRTELPAALAHLQSGNIAPVDLAQASIGPGMSIYTRYAKVLDADGKPVSVREALALINQILDEVLVEQEGDFDADSRWALAWFEHHGFDEGEFGLAETLSKAKNTSIAGIVEGGILVSRYGKVRLLRPNEFVGDWDPTTDSRISVWEAVHRLISTNESSGEEGAARLVSRLGTWADVAREMAYRLYAICERKNRAAEALSYNSIVQSWPEITRLSRQNEPPDQGVLFGNVDL